MNDSLFAIKAAIAACISALAAFLGWKGVMALIWVAGMALDYVSGTMAACRKGEWSSSVARQGLWHKGGMILVVVVSAIADVVLDIMCAHLQLGISWPGILLPLVLAWYIITELGSILENAVTLGAPVPAWLTKLLKAGLSKIDHMGDELTEKKEE